MTRYIQEGPMWRRALVSMVAMLGVSAAFLGVVMLLLGTIFDRAVAPSQDELRSSTHTEQPTDDTAPAAKDAKGVGERS